MITFNCPHHPVFPPSAAAFAFLHLQSLVCYHLAASTFLKRIQSVAGSAAALDGSIFVFGEALCIPFYSSLLSLFLWLSFEVGYKLYPTCGQSKCIYNQPRNEPASPAPGRSLAGYGNKALKWLRGIRRGNLPDHLFQDILVISPHLTITLIMSSAGGDVSLAAERCGCFPPFFSLVERAGDLL